MTVTRVPAMEPHPEDLGGLDFSADTPVKRTLCLALSDDRNMPLQCRFKVDHTTRHEWEIDHRPADRGASRAVAGGAGHALGEAACADAGGCAGGGARGDREVASMSEIRPTGYITRPQLWALDEACKPICEAFGGPPYLVGSVTERPTFRDVDVRLILSDEEYDALPDARWCLLGFMASRHLEAVTGLPIDFQVQRQTDANAAYPGKVRNPLGLRGFEHHWIGDQRPPAPKEKP